MKRIFHVMVNIIGDIEDELVKVHKILEKQNYSDYLVWIPETDEGENGAHKLSQRERFYSREAFYAGAQPEDIVCWLNYRERYLPGTFRLVADTYDENGDIRLLYGDEFQNHETAQTYDNLYHYKPTVSECFLSNYNYIGDTAFVLADVLLNGQYEFEQFIPENNYEVLLRLSRDRECCLHLSKVLLEDNSRFLEKNQKSIVQEQQILQRYFAGAVQEVKERGNRYILEARHDKVKVSIFVCEGEEGQVKDYLKTLTNRTKYPLAEFISCKFSDCESPAVCYGRAVKQASGEYYIFLNGKILPGQSDWIQRLLDAAVIYRAGAVSPLILNKDMSIYHAGMRTGEGGLVDSVYKGKMFSVVDDLFYNQLCTRETSTVSDAVICVHRDKYAEVAGFSSEYATPEAAFLDFGFKIRRTGDNCIYTPFACMVNMGKRTVPPSLPVLLRWGKLLAEDVFFTPEMSRKYFSPQNYQRVYSIGDGRDCGSSSVAILVDDLDEENQYEQLKNNLAEISRDKYVCVFSHKENRRAKDIVDRNIDIIEDSTLLLGSKNIIALLKQFDEVRIQSPVYHNLKQELDLDKIINTYFGVQCVQKTGYNCLLWNEQIDIIVPVYNGYEYLPVLFDSIPKTRMKYRLIIVNDNSPDERIKPFLEEIVNREKNAIYIEHQENQGFVRSVNDALLKSESHVAIVNTDVEVPEEWLERLMTPIILERAVASSTPFTNSGSICSFPEFARNNAIFMGRTVSEIDDVFRQLLPRYYEIPTGVGFCMGMSKYAIKEIGVLDAETFGKGYGEENDWCVRAIEHGYRNVQVNNLFVYHKHGGTFLPAEKQALLQRNLEILGNRHIYFHSEVARFEKRDPYRRFRLYAEMKICMNIDAETKLFFSHNWAGGAISYLQRQKRLLVDGGKRYIGVYYDEPSQRYWIEFSYGNYNFIEKNVTERDLYYLLKEINVQEVILSELISFPNLFGLIDTLKALKEEKGFKMKALVHDFYCVCPSYTLTDSNFVFCDLPDAEACNRCARSNANFGGMTRDIIKWRSEWGQLLQKCDEVVCFSDDSRRHLNKVYGNLKVTVIPHEVDYLARAEHKDKPDNSIRVGIIGAINEVKGINVIEEMADISRTEHRNVDFVIIGYTSRDISCENVQITGKYVRDELPALIGRYGIDIILIPSVWPETFSYTTQEAIMMDMPLAVFNIGAPVERVAKYEKGIIIDEISAQRALDAIEGYIRESRV